MSDARKCPHGAVVEVPPRDVAEAEARLIVAPCGQRGAVRAGCREDRADVRMSALTEAIDRLANIFEFPLRTERVNK